MNPGRGATTGSGGGGGGAATGCASMPIHPPGIETKIPPRGSKRGDDHGKPGRSGSKVARHPNVAIVAPFVVTGRPNKAGATLNPLDHRRRRGESWAERLTAHDGGGAPRTTGGGAPRTIGTGAPRLRWRARAQSADARQSPVFKGHGVPGGMPSPDGARVMRHRFSRCHCGVLPANLSRSSL